MEPVRCPTPPPMNEADVSPKSPPDAPPSPRSSPLQEPEKSTTPPTERPPSPEPNCAICLGKSQNKSFTDSCLHQFCFTCLLEWSKVKPECPLCKQSFKSIIHNVRSNEDYDQYHLRPVESAYPWVNMMDMMEQRLRYRTTLTADRRLERALEHLEHDLQRRVDPGDVIPPQRTWRRRRGLAPDEFRVNVYNQDLWVTSLPCMGMLRDVSPQNFRIHPEEVHRLIPWLNRELQAILRNPGVSARVLDYVITQLPRHHMHSPEFRYQLEPYLRDRYDHFIHEFYTFARSPYDMIGFDENANYSVRGNFWVEVVHEVSSDSSDSDVMVLSPGSNQPVHRHRPGSPVAGPSRAVLPVDQASDSDANNVSSDTSVRDVDTQADPEDSDACVIVGYVKPRHERTPEIITLLSSDTEIEEDVTELPQSRTSYETVDYSFSTTTSSTNGSGSESEYLPSTVRRQRKKVHRKKKPAASKTKSGRSKRRDYSSESDSSECSCAGRKPRRRSSSSTSSSSSSSSSGSWRKKRAHDRKGSWRIQIDVPDVRKGHNYEPPYSSSEINNFLGSSNSSTGRPKLRSIVITRTNEGGKSGRSKAVKKETGVAQSTSSRHRGSSLSSSHSSHHRHDSRKRVKKEEKKKKKRRKEVDSADRKARSSKSKKRKRIVSMFSDSSDD